MGEMIEIFRRLGKGAKGLEGISMPRSRFPLHMNRLIGKILVPKRDDRGQVIPIKLEDVRRRAFEFLAAVATELEFQ